MQAVSQYPEQKDLFILRYPDSSNILFNATSSKIGGIMRASLPDSRARFF